MIKAIIKKDGIITNISEIFPFKEGAVKWVKEQKFDVVDERITQEQALELGLDISQLRSIVVSDELNKKRVYYFIPAPLTVEYVDAREEVQAENERLESLNAIHLCKDIQAELRALNRKKLISGEWTKEKLTQLTEDPLFTKCLNALNLGSLTTFSRNINQATEYYSKTEIQHFINKVYNHQQEWALKGVL